MTEHNSILAQISPLLANFEGREYSAPITRETRFFADLGLMSIEAILLGEKLEAHFGQKIAFQRFLANLAENEATDVHIGQLVDFLVEELES